MKKTYTQSHCSFLHLCARLNPAGTSPTLPPLRKKSGFMRVSTDLAAFNLIISVKDNVLLPWQHPAYLESPKSLIRAGLRYCSFSCEIILTLLTSITVDHILMLNYLVLSGLIVLESLRKSLPNLTISFAKFQPQFNSLYLSLS